VDLLLLLLLLVVVPTAAGYCMSVVQDACSFATAATLRHNSTPDIALLC
jgi:hypothetical protein